MDFINSEIKETEKQYWTTERRVFEFTDEKWRVFRQGYRLGLKTIEEWLKMQPEEKRNEEV